MGLSELVGNLGLNHIAIHEHEWDYQSLSATSVSISLHEHEGGLSELAGNLRLHHSLSRALSGDERVTDALLLGCVCGARQIAPLGERRTRVGGARVGTQRVVAPKRRSGEPRARITPPDPTQTTATTHTHAHTR